MPLLKMRDGFGNCCREPRGDFRLARKVPRVKAESLPADLNHIRVEFWKRSSDLVTVCGPDEQRAAAGPVITQPSYGTAYPRSHLS